MIRNFINKIVKLPDSFHSSIDIDSFSFSQGACMIVNKKDFNCILLKLITYRYKSVFFFVTKFVLS